MNGSPRISGNVSVWSFDAAKAIIHERIAHMKPEDVCTVSIIESRFSSEMEDEKKEEIRHGACAFVVYEVIEPAGQDE